jgi:hypothetical protein
MNGWEFFFSLIILFILITFILSILNQKFKNRYSVKLIVLIVFVFFPGAFHFFGNYDIKIIKSKYTKPIHFEQYKNFIDEKREYKIMHSMIRKYEESNMINKKENLQEELKRKFQTNNKQELIYKIQYYLDKLYTIGHSPDIWKRKKSDEMFYKYVPGWLKNN